jgi:hypothetical protein
LIAALAKKTKGAPHAFPPHITLASGFIGYQKEAVEATQLLVAAINQPFNIVLSAKVESSTTAVFRAVTLRVRLTEGLAAARAAAMATWTPTATNVDAADVAAAAAAVVLPTYEPHLSLLYGNYEQPVLDSAVALVERSAGKLTGSFPAARLILMATTTADYHCWTEVASFPLPR